MNLKYLLISAVLGGLASFIWGGVYHMGIGIDMRVMQKFDNSRATSEAIRDHSSGNGVYYTNEGVIAFVNMTPDLADHTQMSMTPQLIKQYVINAVTAGLLAWLLSFTAIRSAACAAGFTALIGLTAAVAADVAAWNWYGHPLNFTLAMIVDLTVSFLVAGFVIGWARKKFAPATG